MHKPWDYNNLMLDRKLFNDTVYTPLAEALKELDKRQKNSKLKNKVEKLLNGDVPEFFRENKKTAVLYRHIATPNNETQHFLSLIKNTSLQPVICEYHDDIFTPDANEYKRALTKLQIHKESLHAKQVFDKENLSIVDFNKFRGKPIKELTTLWGESLIDFHHNLLKTFFPGQKIALWDSSVWCKNNGLKPAEYYKKFFLFFIAHGIFFENFLFNMEELNFSKKVILPAIEDVIKTVGIKPLVVPIISFEAEKLGSYWYYYPCETKKIVKEKLQNRKK